MSDINNNEEKSIEEPLAENVDKKPSKSQNRKKFIREFVDYIEMFAVAVGIVVLLFSFCFRLCTVSGDSMNDTLIHGERVIISDILYSPKRGDIIVFHDTKTLNEPVIKRVIATEGETVQTFYTDTGMTVKITDKDGNESHLEEEYTKYLYPTYLPNTYTVPEGKVFVMGDNRSNSKDSRHPDIGFVDERSILGRVLFRVTPLSKLGEVK